jgi:uncharacterized protein (TIGR02145 family)
MQVKKMIFNQLLSRKLTRCTIVSFYSFLLNILLFPTGANAQILNEMDIKEVESRVIPLFLDYPTKSAIVIESTIIGLKIESNIGIVNISSSPDIGEYRVIIEPRRQTLTLSAPGYVRKLYQIHDVGQKEVIKLRVTPLNVRDSADEIGKGSVEITTEPSFADIKIVGLPGTYKSPFIESDIFALAYTVRVSKEGFQEEVFTVDLKPGILIKKNIILKPIVSNEVITNPKINVQKEGVEPTIPDVKKTNLIEQEDHKQNNGDRLGTTLDWQCGDRVVDIDGNAYTTTSIDSMCWMTENLRTTRFSDGTEIPYVDNASLWRDMNAGALSIYSHNIAFDATFGKLYNWYAVNDNKNICPVGWTVPSDDDWTAMINLLNRTRHDGKGSYRFKLSAAAELGFWVQTAGYRFSNGDFHYMGQVGHWWTKTTQLGSTAWTREIVPRKGIVTRHNYLKNNGFSVRCIKNEN